MQQIFDKETGIEIKPANARACARCPWRLSNQGKPHPHGFYSKVNLRRLWTGMKNGERMTCHPTDPRMAEFEGYEGTAESPVVRECAGALLLKAREWRLVEECAREAEAEGKKDGLQRYRRRRPKGLTKEGVANIAWDLMVGGSVLALAMRKSIEDDADVGYPPLDA